MSYDVWYETNVFVCVSRLFAEAKRWLREKH